MHRLRRPSALLVALLVFAIAAAGLLATRAPAPYALPRAVAVHDALRSHKVTQVLGSVQRWTRVDVGPVDGQVTRVSFLVGRRTVADVGVARSGAVLLVGTYLPYGAPTSHAPWLILLGSLCFLLATAVVPLRRVRNLDVLALVAFVAPLLLLDGRYVTASTLAAIPSLAWLCARCAWAALGARGEPAPSRPLLDAITPDWSETQRVRMLRIAVGAAAAAVTMVTLTAPGTVDVAQAVMEGGTLLVHGTLPYGHMPGDVFHGDTYPLLSYLAYAPLAALMPVRDAFDVANGALIVAAACSLGVAWMLVRSLHGSAGLRAALAWLAFPPLLVAVSSGTSDLLLAALLAAALVLARRRVASAGLIVAAGWFKLVPFALLPVWVAGLRGRRLAAAVVLLAASTAATLALLVALGGGGAPARMLHDMTYQLERRTLHMPWTLLGMPWLQPLVQAGVLALIAGATVRAWRDAAFAEDRARLAAFAGAVLLGLQLAGNYWTYLYLAWVLPCIALSLLAGAEQRAPAPEPARAPARAPALV
jgi:hypothetical protein